MRLFLNKLLTDESITERLLRYVDDIEIYETFLGQEVEIGEAIVSPIRSSDEFPSFTVFVPTRIKDTRPDEVWFKDLATGEYGNVFKFIRLIAKHQYNTEIVTTYDTIKFIDSQLELGMIRGDKVKKVKVARDLTKFKIKKEINYSPRRFTQKDLDYWGVLLQEEADLNYWEVRSVGKLLTPENIVTKRFRQNNLVFAYNIWDKCKLYQPKATRKYKFRNSCPANDYRYYQGFKQLDTKAKTLIITKSFKDVMVIHKIFTKFVGIKIAVLAPHAESINLNVEFIEWAQKHYERIIIVSDFDLAGVKFAQKGKKMGIEYIFVSTERIEVEGKMIVLEKDVSDYLTINGCNKTVTLLKSWNIS